MEGILEAMREIIPEGILVVNLILPAVRMVRRCRRHAIYIKCKTFTGEAFKMYCQACRNQNARWYYCSAIANYGVGNNLVAMEHAQRAASMEPGNPEYTNLVNQFQWRGQRYQNTGYGYGRPTFGTGNMCCDLWCADQMCECMGGDLCSCM